MGKHFYLFARSFCILFLLTIVIIGATVVGMSHNDKKKDVAKELGCDGFINTSDEASMNKYKNKLTHILCTGNGRDFQCK
jgi:D-arabinose 1-dehydrogenase-like Zn-dependent alcohol dehydrogenase